MRKEMRMVSHPAPCQHSGFYWEGRCLRFLEKRKENESDPSAAKWLLTCLPQTLGCLLFSFKWRQARPGCLHPCRWSRPGRLLLIASGNGTRCFQLRGTFTSSLRNNQWGRQTFSPCRPGPSSAGTLIGSAAPVWTGSSGGPLEPGGNVLGPNMADLGGAARGKKWEMLPSWAVMRWNVLGGPCGSFGFRVCWCVLRLVKALSFSHSSPSSRSLKLDWCCLPARSFWLSFLYSRRIWVFVFLFFVRFGRMLRLPSQSKNMLMRRIRGCKGVSLVCVSSDVLWFVLLVIQITRQ